MIVDCDFRLGWPFLFVGADKRARILVFILVLEKKAMDANQVEGGGPG